MDKPVTMDVSLLTILMFLALVSGLMIAMVIDWAFDHQPRSCCACSKVEPQPRQLYMCPECRGKLEKRP